MTYAFLHRLIVECAAEHPLLIQKYPCMAPLEEAMRSKVDKPGNDWAKFMTVCIPMGKVKHLDEHAHQEHTVLYYVEPGIIVIEGKEYRPEIGEFLYLEPNVLHAVPAPTARRVSVAMTVKVDT